MKFRCFFEYSQVNIRVLETREILQNFTNEDDCNTVMAMATRQKAMKIYEKRILSEKVRISNERINFSGNRSCFIYSLYSFIGEIWSEGSQLFRGNYFQAIVLRNLFSNGFDRNKLKADLIYENRWTGTQRINYNVCCSLIMCD